MSYNDPFSGDAWQFLTTILNLYGYALFRLQENSGIQNMPFSYFYTKSEVVLPNLTFQLWSYVITPQHRGKTGQQQRDNRRGTSLFPHKSVVKPGTWNNPLHRYNAMQDHNTLSEWVSDLNAVFSSIWIHGRVFWHLIRNRLIGWAVIRLLIWWGPPALYSGSSF